METSYNCAIWRSATTYQKINSSIVSKGVINSFNKKFPLARMFPLAIMHTPLPLAERGGGEVHTMWRYSYVVFYLKWVYFFTELILHITSFRFFARTKFCGCEILHITQIISRKTPKSSKTTNLFDLLNPLKV